MPKHYIPRICRTCNAPFLATASNVNMGWGNYCSRACNRRPLTSAVDLFRARVDTSGEHWLWTGAINVTTGYGYFKAGGRNGQSFDAHRFAWEQWGGTIPDGLCVCHTCDIRVCARNDDEGTYEVAGVLYPRFGHLWLGTRAANLKDMAAKGRAASGDRNGSRLYPELARYGDRNPARQHPERLRRGSTHGLAKLTEAAVLEIRRAYAAREATQDGLAQVHGVSQRTIGDVILRKLWTHV